MQITTYPTLAPQSRPHPQISLIAPDDRLRRLARLLHRLGERPLYEFLRELAAGADPIERLEIYSRIDPQVLQLHGGNDLPPNCTVRR